MLEENQVKIGEKFSKMEFKFSDVVTITCTFYFTINFKICKNKNSESLCSLKLFIKISN